MSMSKHRVGGAPEKVYAVVYIRDGEIKHYRLYSNIGTARGMVTRENRYGYEAKYGEFKILECDSEWSEIQ